MKLDKVVFYSPGNCLKNLMDAIEQLPLNPYGEDYIFEVSPTIDVNEVSLFPHGVAEDFNTAFNLPDGARNVLAHKSGSLSFDYGGCNYHLNRRRESKGNFYLLIKDKEKR